MHGMPSKIRVKHHQVCTASWPPASPYGAMLTLNGQGGPPHYNVHVCQSTHALHIELPVKIKEAPTWTKPSDSQRASTLL